MRSVCWTRFLMGRRSLDSLPFRIVSVLRRTGTLLRRPYLVPRRLQRPSFSCATFGRSATTGGRMLLPWGEGPEDTSVLARTNESCPRGRGRASNHGPPSLLRPSTLCTSCVSRVVRWLGRRRGTASKTLSYSNAR